MDFFGLFCIFNEMSMSIHADIIVIGAGAAGLMALYGAAQNGKCKVIALEKMSRPGRKIMLTGKGRCNFTNVKEWQNFAEHIYPKANFLKPAFFNMTPQRLIETFENYGLKCVTERGDRAFPISHKSMDVVDTLTYMARACGADIQCEKEVVRIETPENGTTEKDSNYTLHCSDGSSYTAKKLIITTGGLSYPVSGSTGDGYRWAEETGHKVTERMPSLTAIVPQGYKIIEGQIGNHHISRNLPMSNYGNSLCGISLKNIGLRLIADGNVVDEVFGDADFTDGGLEGPSGFKISRKCVACLRNGARTSIILDLKPAVELNELNTRVQRLWKEITEDRRSRNLNYEGKFKVLMTKLMPGQLIFPFSKHFPTADHKTIARYLKNWEFRIEGYVGYERCVITAGGISTKDIVSKSMESKLHKGLFFAGEVIDLDADTGGYNLHIAFCTGYTAGMSAASSV